MIAAPMLLENMSLLLADDDLTVHDATMLHQVGRMRAASLRLGGQGIKCSYGDHILICGDAAGHIDPITGEGIHTGMMVSAPLPPPLSLPPPPPFRLPTPLMSILPPPPPL